MTTIDALHSEIEALHAESMARLNRMAWPCADLAPLCEFLGEQLAQHDTHRAKFACTVLQGAANDTSRRIAVRLVTPWFSDEVAQALGVTAG